MNIIYMAMVIFIALELHTLAALDIHTEEATNQTQEEYAQSMVDDGHWPKEVLR